jgi:hypothetical protein
MYQSFPSPTPDQTWSPPIFLPGDLSASPREGADSDLRPSLVFLAAAPLQEAIGLFQIQ